MPTNSNKVQFNYITRAAFDNVSFTKDDNTFYSVKESNNNLTLC